MKEGILALVVLAVAIWVLVLLFRLTTWAINRRTEALRYQAARATYQTDEPEFADAKVSPIRFQSKFNSNHPATDTHGVDTVNSEITQAIYEIQQAINRDDLSTAEKSLLQLRTSHWRNHEVHFLLGSCKFQMGSLEAAESSFRESLALNLDHPQSHYGLGLVLERSGRTGEAIEAFRRAVELHPQYAQAVNKLKEHNATVPSSEPANAPHSSTARINAAEISEKRVRSRGRSSDQKQHKPVPNRPVQRLRGRVTLRGVASRVAMKTQSMGRSDPYRILEFRLSPLPDAEALYEPILVFLKGKKVKGITGGTLMNGELVQVRGRVSRKGVMKVSKFRVLETDEVIRMVHFKTRWFWRLLAHLWGMAIIGTIIAFAMAVANH